MNGRSFIRSWAAYEPTSLDRCSVNYKQNKKYLSIFSNIDLKNNRFVDCIHTSLLGLPDAICDKDFYPNGGIDQPGCPTITDGKIDRILFILKIWQYMTIFDSNKKGVFATMKNP